MLQRILHLIVKELLAVWRDRRSRVVLIAPPLLQLFIFANAVTQEVRNVHIAVLNRDWSQDSRELISRFRMTPTFTEIVALRDESEIAPTIDSQRAVMVMEIGPDFSRRLAAGEAPELGFILDGRRSNTAQIVEGYATSIVQQFAAERGVRAPPGPARAQLVTRAWFNPNLEARWNTVPSLIAILTALIGLLVTGLSVAREREFGTFEQLLVSPLRPIEILIGKTVPALIIGLIEGTVIVLAGAFIFGVPFRGSVALLYVGMVVYLLAIIGVGLFISSLATTQQQAVLGAFTFQAPAVTLSGFATPIANMPNWLQTMTLANPLRHFLVIVKGVLLKDMPPEEVARNLVPMVLIAAVTLTVATWFFRRRLQ